MKQAALFLANIAACIAVFVLVMYLFD